MNTSADRLMAKWLEGDDAAAKEIVDQYMHRVLPLARKYIGPKLQARFDPEDVAQSVFRSFFRKAEGGEFTLRRNRDLWALLAQITVNKVRKRIERELAQKRDAEREVRMPSSCEITLHEPKLEDAELLIEELQRFMEVLKPRDRRILELRLQDESHAEIALQIGCSEATVRRVLRMLGEALRARLRSEG